MPRAGLTTTRVVEEAEAVADEVGLPSLTLAAVASRLGVRLPSLYKHIDGMDALQRQLSIRAKTELGDAMARSAMGLSGREALQALGQCLRTWALAHPGRYAATVAAPAPDDDEDWAASTAAVAVVLAVLAGYGLGDDAAIDATRAIRSALHGFIALEAAGGFGLPVNIDRSYAALVDALDVALSTWPTPPPQS